MGRRSLAWVLAFTAFACGGSTTPVPDSTSSGSSGSASSSSGVQGCTTEAMICPDGKTSVGRTGPNCTFAPCPDAKDGGVVGCPDIAKQCPDGSYVGATGPNCEFVCPNETCESLAAKARSEIDAVLKANSSCNGPDDCTNVAYATDCFSSCTRAMNKDGLDKLAAAKESANANECKAFKAQDCKLSIPPCVAPFPPKCVDHQCQ